MPFNGSGGTTQPGGGGFPAVASTLIQSAKVNISVADIYSMLAMCLLKDGQQVAIARIPFAAGISADTINEKTSGAGVTFGNVLNTPQGVDIACAATINLETATGNVVDVTGSTGPVTAITLSQGHWRIVRFTGTPTLTNGASLVLPGAANIVVAAGDYALFVGYAAGVVRCWYMRADGTAITTAPFTDTVAIVKGSSDATKKVRIEADGLTTATTRVITMPDADVDLTLLSGTQTANKVFAGPASGAAAAPTFRVLVGAESAMVLLSAKSASSSASLIFGTSDFDWTAFDEYEFHFDQMVPSAGTNTWQAQISQDGGSTFKNGAGSYDTVGAEVSATTVTGFTNTTTAATFNTGSTQGTSTQGYGGWCRIIKPASTVRKTGIIGSYGFTSQAAVFTAGLGGVFEYNADTNAWNGIKFFYSSGNITSGTIYAYGVRKA